MTFSYNRDIPDAPNNPSVDQPKMKTNTNSTDSLIAVDHVSFNTANGGQHKAITFNQDVSYVPVPPVSPPELFTNAVSGLPQLFYYSGNAAQSSSQYSTGANFSTFLFGGMILKGGLITLAAGTTMVVTYSALVPAIAPFINNTLAVVLNEASGTGFVVRVTAKNATTFTVTYPASAAGTQFYFIAIGF